MQARGFRVVEGSPVHESILRQAGADRALAIMIALDDPAATVLAALNCRRLSKRLFIAAAAYNDELGFKLRRAGADRVITPFQVAAQIVLLSALRPVVSDFFQCIIYNYQTGLETTELYVTTLPAKAGSFSGYARRNRPRSRLTAPSGPILSSSRGLGRSDFYAWDDFPRQPLSELLRCAASGKPPGLQALCSLTPDRIDIYSSTDVLSLKGVKRIPHRA